MLGEFSKELLASLLVVVAWLLHPGMLAKLIDGGPLIAIVGEHLEDQVLEVGAQPVSVHLCPVRLMLLVQQQAVEELLLSSLLEGKYTLHDNE